MRSGTGELSAVDDEIFIANWSPVEPTFKDLAGAAGVARLSREAGSGNVRRHAVMRHRAPGMILRCRLRIPDVAGVAGELSALKGSDDGVAIANQAARRVHEVCTTLHFADQCIVEEIQGFGVQRRV